MNDEVARMRSNYEEEIALLRSDIEVRDTLLKRICQIITDNELKPIKPEWHENIPKHGVLCWVSEMFSDCRDKNPRIVTEKRGDVFITTFGGSWKQAIPLTNEEIEEFKR